MLKEVTIACFLVFSLFVSLLGFVSAQNVDRDSEHGSNWDKSCNGDTCTLKVYSYEKYWNDGNSWANIDEKFFDCSADSPDGSQRYCTNNYHYNVNADDSGRVSAYIGDERYEMTLADLFGTNFRFNPRAEGNILTYPDVVPGVDLRYQFLPTKLKEDLVIRERPVNVPERDFQISFNRAGNADFSVIPFTICDSNFICVDLRSRIEADSIRITIPREFLLDENTQYPVYIDPTISLDDSSINWNGGVYNLTNASGSFFIRTNNPAGTILISDSSPPIGSSKHNNGAIDWNISAIPDSSVIYEANLSLYIGASGVFGTPIIPLSVNQMEGSNEDYADQIAECDGNCNFYTDMGNGSIYYNNTFSGAQHINISLSSQALTDLENSLTGDIFSTGFTSDNSLNRYVASRDNVDSSKRPVLTIVYGVNGSDSDNAIEEGIMASALNATSIETNKQIYIVNELGEQYLGTFDKVTTYQNQTWAFHYVLPGDSFLNIPSLFNIFNTWENQSLSYQEIVDQVGAFVNATRI